MNFKLFNISLLLVAVVAEGAAADASAGTSSASPQPYARVRVSIPPAGGRAEIRETTPAANAPAATGYQPTVTSSYGDYLSSSSSSREAAPETGTAPETRVLAVLYGKDITDADVIRELLERRGRETLEWIIGRDILRHELERLELEVTNDEVDERLEKHLEGFRKAFPNATRPDDLTRAASGMRLDEYRERSVWVELALRKIMRVALKPTQQQLKSFYAERRQSFIRPERVRISQVFIAPRSNPEAEGIAGAEDWEVARRQILEADSRLRMGDDFAAVARTYGTGGQLSRWVGHGELLRELEEAAFAIRVGSNTAPIKSSMGYHIIHVEEKVDRKVPPFEEVREEVLAQYEEMQFVMRAGEFMSRLREKAAKNGGLVLSSDAETFPESAVNLTNKD